MLPFAKRSKGTPVITLSHTTETTMTLALMLIVVASVGAILTQRVKLGDIVIHVVAHTTKVI